MNFRTLITVFLVSFLFSSCNSQNPDVKNLNPAEFEKGINQSEVQLVDVRTPEEYAEKWIIDAQNINIDDNSFEKKMKGLDKSKPLYLYCLMGARSAKAGDWASKHGFKEIYNLSGGITAWIDDKKPVVAGPKSELTEAMSFDDYLNHLKASEKLVLVDFNAVWCGPCKLLKPVVQKVLNKNQDKVTLFDIDVDKNPSVANTMNVRSIPLLILYKMAGKFGEASG